MLLFENRWQARKVRWLTISFAVWCLAWLYWAWTTLENYGIEPADGGALRSFPERLGMAVVIALCGVLPLAGMAFYSSLYLTRIERHGDAVLLTALGALRPVLHRYAVADLVPGKAYEGRVSGRISVDAPWLTLRVTDRKMPFVVDLQAERADVAAIVGLSAGRG